MLSKVKESFSRNNKRIAITLLITYQIGCIIYALTALFILHGQTVAVDAYSILYWPIFYFESFVIQLMTFIPGIIQPSLAAMIHISVSAIISYELAGLVIKDVHDGID